MISLLIYLSVLQILLYRAVRTAFGLIGNGYILGSQVEDLKYDLESQMRDMEGEIGVAKDDVRVMKSYMRVMKDDLRDLLRCQIELEVNDMAFVGKLVMDCSKKR